MTKYHFIDFLRVGEGLTEGLGEAATKRQRLAACIVKQRI